MLRKEPLLVISRPVKLSKISCHLIRSSQEKDKLLRWRVSQTLKENLNFSLLKCCQSGLETKKPRSMISKLDLNKMKMVFGKSSLNQSLKMALENSISHQASLISLKDNHNGSDQKNTLKKLCMKFKKEDKRKRGNTS
jgi:hypothetical protein